jgi:type I restriction enzyme M protein
MITGDMKNKVDALWTTFWNNGISNPLSVIEQVSYLLFIKRLDDLELVKERKANRLGRQVSTPRFGPDQQQLRWSKFKHMGDHVELLRVVRDEAFPFIQDLGGDGGETSYARHMKDAVFLISNAALLANVVSQIDVLPLEDRDTKGDLYEYMLSKLTTAGTNGQFRTPRHIIKMMVKLLDPKPRDIVCDPACGTAGFLVAASEHVRDEMLTDPQLREHYNRHMFHGFDFDATMLRIGSMNMMLHGIEDPDIEARDSLADAHGLHKEQYTVVLANPPFKGSVEKSTIAKDLSKVVSTSKTELLFLALFLRLMKTGGRAAVIVPDGVLFGSSKAHKEIRRVLVEEHKLDGVISMPSGVFKPYAGVSTAIMLFTKTGVGGTDSVWFYDMQADGLSLDDKRQDVEDNDIPDILKKWALRDPSTESDRLSKAFFVPKSEIAENKYDLSINRYKEIEYEEVEYDPPKVIIDRLEALQIEIAGDLRQLRGLL